MRLHNESDAKDHLKSAQTHNATVKAMLHKTAMMIDDNQMNSRAWKRLE